MPLEKSKSSAARSRNIATEIKAGKPAKQAEAIGYSIQRKAGGHAAEGEVEPLPEDLGHVVGLSKKGLPLVSLGTGHHIEVHPSGLDKEQGAQYAEHLAKMLPHHDDLDAQLEHAAKGMLKHAADGDITPAHDDPDTSAVDAAAEAQPVSEAAMPPPREAVSNEVADPISTDEEVAGVGPGSQQWGAPNTADAGTPPSREFAGRTDMYGNPDLQASEPSDMTTVRGMSKDNPDYKEWADVEPWMKAEGARQSAIEQGKDIPENLLAEPNEPGSKEDIAAKDAAAKKSTQPKPQDELDQAAKELAAIDAKYPQGASVPDHAPAPAPVDGGGSAYNNAVKVVESGGNPNARNANPGATAAGLYGFTDSTWTRLGMAGKSKLDPANQEEAMRRLTAENARALKTNDPVKLYAAHNSGFPAVQRAEAAAAAAGHPDQWLNYLVTPTGKGNQDPNQGQKAVRQFVQALSKQARTTTPEASAPQASADGSSSIQGMAQKFLMGATPEGQEPQAKGIFEDTDPFAATAHAVVPAATAVAQGVGRFVENPASLGMTDEPQTSTPAGVTPSPAAAPTTPPPVEEGGSSPDTANFSSPTGEAGTAPAPTAADNAPYAPPAPLSPIEAAIADADDRARQIAEQTGLANQAGMKEAEQVGVQGKYDMQAHQELANQLSKSIDDFQNAQNLVNAQAQQQMTNYHNAYQHLAQTRIDPSHWWSTRSAGQKFLGILGVLISGFSGAKENMGMDVIQKNIDRDIDAQKANYGIQKDVADSNKSLFQMNMENFKNQTAATTATQAMLWSKTAQQLAAQAAQASGPIAASKAQQAAAEANVRSIALQGQAHQQALQSAESALNLRGLAQKQQMLSTLLNGHSSMDPGTYNAAAEQLGLSTRKVAGIPELEGKLIPKEVAAGISKDILPFDSVRDDLQKIQEIRDKYPISMSVPGLPIAPADRATLAILNKKLNADYIRASEGEAPSTRTLGEEALGKLTPDVRDADWFGTNGTSGPIETLKLLNDTARGRVLEKYGYSQPHPGA